MTLRCWRAALAARLRGQSVERELDEEIRVHLEMLVEEHVRRGMTERDARRAARRSFGVVASVKEARRQADALYWLDTAAQDVRNGVRLLRRAPGFTAAAVLTLALGIGANVAVFTFVDAVILRPLPFDEPERLVMLSESHIESGQQRVGVLPGSFLDWRDRSHSFEAISLLWSGPFLITNRQEPARITGAQVSPNFFELMRVEPLLGRTFPSTEAETAGHESEIVISHRLWQRWFGGDPDVLGQALEVSARTGRMLENPDSMRPRWDRLALFYADVVERVEALPGIDRAAVVAAPALAGREAAWFARTGIVPPRLDKSPEWRVIQHRVVTPGYFDVLRLPLLRGRAFSDQDHALEFLRSGTGRRRGVAIVNQAAARHLWPGQEALGGALTIDGDSRVDGRLVVGIATDARDLAADVEPQPTVYVPFAESPDFGATLVARGKYGEHEIAAIREELRATDAFLAIGTVRPLTDDYAVALAPRRFTTLVLTTFAGFGLLLAGVGLYGVVAMSVAQRSREFGIRVALGATRERLHQMVLGETALIVGLGMTIGAVGAAGGTELLRSQLFGVEPLDGGTWGVTAVILAATGLAAAWLPARRAARLDPVETLKAE